MTLSVSGDSLHDALTPQLQPVGVLELLVQGVGLPWCQHAAVVGVSQSSAANRRPKLVQLGVFSSVEAEDNGTIFAASANCDATDPRAERAQCDAKPGVCRTLHLLMHLSARP